eukprot:gene12279-16468_t
MFKEIILIFLPLLPSLVAYFFIYNDLILPVIYYSLFISIIGYTVTTILVPIFAAYTLKRGLSGKDMGKKGTNTESVDVPEALGIVPGIVYLVCTICSSLIYATPRILHKTEALPTSTLELTIIFHSTLFSICFMIFLGFMDDTLDLKWRYKLILPTIASLPLLASYSGLTAMYLPKPLTFLVMNGKKLTLLGEIINFFATVDTEAHGSIIELGSFFLLFMGLQAVFCTNAINILAGINGLECGQSYIIACSILFFKLYEITQGGGSQNEIFTIVIILPFIGTSLGLLRHNWYPAKIFVGDTYCYFAGMTFAVVGIHGHFSKTLLLLFIPQIINFLYSIPQLFKIIPCPRHRLPRIDPKTRLMNYSIFPCESNQYKWFKVHSNDKECPNCTLICLVLRAFGPMYEPSLCIVLLTIQVICSAFAFYIRYHVFY